MQRREASSLRWPPILMYHSISNLSQDPNMICTSPDLFEAQLRYLKRRGLRGVSIRELLQSTRSGDAGNLVGLTFDDAYTDFLTVAVPLLRRHGFGATVFAVAGRSENDWKHAYRPRPRLSLLDDAELREVHKSGMEVGAHSMTHPNLSELEPENAYQEISESRRVLGETLGEEVTGFCYPYGGLNSAALQSVKQAGFAYGCAWNTDVEGSVYELPRTPLSNRDSLFRFAAKLKVYSRYVRVKRVFS